jgi:hypothetical protein
LDRRLAAPNGPGSVLFSQHADERSPKRPVLLAFDQLDEGCGSAGSSKLADSLGPLEVGEHQDVE